MVFSRIKITVFAITALCLSAGFGASAPAPAFKVIAFYSDKAATGKGYLGIDPAHINFAHESNGFFPGFATDNGFTYDSTMDWTKVGDSSFLSQYDVAMWLNDQPGTTAQMTGFRKWMDRGGALICFHVCAYYDNSMIPWSWYFDSLIGTGSFKNNTWLPTAAKMHIEDTTFSITKDIPTTFMGPVNEWYSFTKDVSKNANIKVIFKIDDSAFPVGTQTKWNSGYYPIAWANTKWKAFYDNSGHNNMNYSTNQGLSRTWDPQNQAHTQLILNTLRWLAEKPTSVMDPAEKKLLSPGATMHIVTNRHGLTVTRAGIHNFEVTLIDLKGNRLSSGQATNGVYADNNLHLSRGVYILRSTSPQGETSRVLSILR